jgi:hypothetical protein
VLVVIYSFMKPAGTRVSALFEKHRFLHVLEGLIGFSAPRNPMETSNRTPGAPGDPTSMGAEIGVVSGYLPLTQGNQVLEALPLILK